MPIDTTPSQVATSALQAIPFSSLIGGPLDACIQAQAKAAQTTWQFIQQVGLTQDNTTKETKAVNVTFQFQQNGKMVNLSVPLLTIVPIPYIAINTIDINFKANISASSSSVQDNTESTTMGGEVAGSASLGVGPFSIKADFKANYSSKKDSKATQESKYSVEYTMDVAVKAGQESMPAGLAKVLELLGNSMSVADPKGTLTLNLPQIKINTNADKDIAKLIVTFKNGNGLLMAGQDVSVIVAPAQNVASTAQSPAVLSSALQTSTTDVNVPVAASGNTYTVKTDANGAVEFDFTYTKSAAPTPPVNNESLVITVTSGDLKQTATLLLSAE